MGETCDVCGREEQDCAYFSGQLSTMGSTLAEALDCYKVGFGRLRALYRGWQDEIDRHRLSLLPNVAIKCPWCETMFVTAQVEAPAAPKGTP